MSDRSTIEWTGATWSPVYGCTKVDPACARCYIERTVPYRVRGLRFVDGRIPVQLFPERLDAGKVRKLKPLDRPIFVCSLSDLFHEDVPDEYLHRVFDVIASCPERVFQVLTKRIERARDFLPGVDGWLFPNVWVGTTIANARFTWRADVLREVPAAVRFISAEPLLGSLFPPAATGTSGSADWGGFKDAGDGTCSSCGRVIGEHAGRGCFEPRASGLSPGRAPLDLTGIDWVIAGGESGGRATRAMQPEWVRELRDACLNENLRRDPNGLDAAGPAFFFKQWGSHGELGDYVGASAKSAGRLLDGREWNEMPGVLVAA